MRDAWPVTTEAKVPATPSLSAPPPDRHTPQRPWPASLPASRPPGPAAGEVASWPSPTGLRARAGHISGAWSSSQACLVIQSRVPVIGWYFSLQGTHKPPPFYKGKRDSFPARNTGIDQQTGRCSSVQNQCRREEEGERCLDPTQQCALTLGDAAPGRQAGPRCEEGGLGASQAAMCEGRAVRKGPWLRHHPWGPRTPSHFSELSYEKTSHSEQAPYMNWRQ